LRDRPMIPPLKGRIALFTSVGVKANATGRHNLEWLPRRFEIDYLNIGVSGKVECLSLDNS
jgi:hypothetical protein